MAMSEKSEKKAIDVFHPEEGEDVSGEWDEGDVEEIKQMLGNSKKTAIPKVVRY